MTEPSPEAILKKTKIKRLVMDGFKSFGKYTELLFDDKFNIIMGPNGSGKSNVLDALCFVLGKSSSKQLRAEKSANLIYNGGKTKQPAKKAEVSIVFDNSTAMFPLQDKEIKISRIVRSDGASKYKINGKTRTRTEMMELLNHAKINPDGYNIILQGDIIRLVEMSMTERRQIIEEIAGIGLYEEKKQQAINELTKVENKLNEAEIILKERQQYLKDLKKDRDQAVKYKELNDKIKTNKASYLKRQKDKKEEILGKLNERKAKYQQKLDKLQAEIKNAREQIAEQKNKIKEISDEIERKGETEQIALQKQAEAIRVGLATNKTRISQCKEDITKIQKRKDQLERNLSDIKDKSGSLKEEHQSNQAQVEALEKTLNEILAKIGAFKKKHNIQDEAEIDKQMEEMDKNADTKQQQIQQNREKQQDVIREVDKIEFQLATIDEKIAKVQQLEQEHKTEIAELKNKKSQFKKLAMELNDVLNKDSQAARDLAKARQELHESREEEHKLSIKQSSIKDSISANLAVKKVKENKDAFGEVHGTIAELGSTESKYSLALETAAANKINSIVTGCDKTAANAIKYLKKEKLGTATFLPLNKIKPSDARKELKELLQQKGVHGLAIDLIEFEPRYKNAFSHVFGSTVVVESIDTARKIGIGKARMVTLDGDLAERSGAMVGGYRHKKQGSFREKELGNKIERLQHTIAELETQTASMEKQRAKNEDEIARIRELKANLEGDIIKQEKSLHIDTQDLEASQKYKEELINLKEKLSKDQKEVQDIIVGLTRELTEIKVEKQKLRTKISELRNPRVLAELNAFEEKRRQLEQEKIRLEEKQKNLDAQVKEVLGRDEESTKGLIEDLAKEQKAFEKEIKHLTEHISKQEEELGRKEKEQEKFHAQFKGLFEKRNKLSDKVTENETEILGKEDLSRKEELQLNTLSIEEARQKAELAGIDSEYEKYEGVELDMKTPEEELKKQIQQFERMMTTIGTVNMRALEIYETAENEYGNLLGKNDVLIKEKESVMGLMDQIESRKTEMFTKALDVVNSNFQDIFGKLTTKGQAYLELENKEQPFEGGLRIKVKLTGEKFMDIRSLSGGEKTMTALAFLFAIQEHEPATFYIMDEVDAALDKHNSEKLAKLIRDYCGRAQYIVISHNDAVITEGDVLYGVSMKQDCGLSKVVSLRA
ncbi:chromosome segregation protein SMC [Candidatus Woesearchaeota archaeon]|nr:chromosome segregation protein SMC [Candidatus Woesearchaeota archaeon]